MAVDIDTVQIKPAYVPDAVLSAIVRRRNSEYTDFRKIYWCIASDQDEWVGVVGDGANGAYEYFIFRKNVLEVSNMGYGSPHLPLRDVLNRVDPPSEVNRETI